MKKGTKITHKPHPFNSDGDHDIKWDKTEKVNEEDFNTIFDDPENFFMHIHEGNIYGVNKLIFRGKRFTLLEPNPVTFYFSAAYDMARQINDAYNKLEHALDKVPNAWPVSVSYSYIFKVSSMCIIFAYSACDAFLNQRLPEYRTINIEGKELTKKDIERLALERKLKAVSTYTQKDFATKHPRKMKKLLELRDLRNQLIHLKEKRRGIATSYNDIYQIMLELDLTKIMNTVKSFINFYHPKLIVNYNYGK